MLIMSRKENQEKERKSLAIHDLDGRQGKKEGRESEKVEHGAFIPTPPCLGEVWTGANNRSCTS